LVAVAQPFLEKLGKATGETVNLGVTSNGMVEQIAQVDSTYMIGGTNWVGLSVPLHCSALGKVLLAFGAAHLPSAGKLDRRTEQTITTEAALKTDLATVRARGYAVTDQELEPGLIAIAAPVFGFDGAVVAALSVSAPTSRMTPERVPVAAERLMEEAAGLSAVLGYRQRAARHRKAGAA
jgi:DNA-binding IclR family transcriptional regulator